MERSGISIPFVLRMQPLNCKMERASCDQPDDEVHVDPLPAAMHLGRTGIVRHRGTRVTDVKQETLDDN